MYDLIAVRTHLQKTPQPVILQVLTESRKINYQQSFRTVQGYGIIRQCRPGI